tara:strand:+ start:854 stop:1669 length:816 start_codon:yes stop_codon:yes gene_type:complete
MPRKCGLCEKEGHNRSKCPEKEKIEKERFEKKKEKDKLIEKKRFDKGWKSIEKNIKKKIKEYDESKDRFINIKKKMEKFFKKIFPTNRSKNLENRETDTYYWFDKDILNCYDIKYNVRFLPKDARMKLEIFEISRDNICIITGQKSNGIGDHLYEIRGYYKATGHYGSETQWNILPVIGSENKKYKKMAGKDIGYQELTDEELTTCSESQRELYVKIQKWKQYCKERGANIYWDNLQHKKLYELIKKSEEFITKVYKEQLIPFRNEILKEL